MRVVLFTFGSLGDVHPYIAVGLELQRRGHDAAIATSAYYRDKVESLGLGFHPLRPDAPGEFETTGFMERVMHPRNGPSVVIRDIMMASLRETHEDVESAAEGADLLVSHPLTFPVPVVATRRGLPWASTALAPMSFLSAHNPPILPPVPWLAALRPLGSRFHGWMFDRAARSIRHWFEPYHALRREHGLPAAPDAMRGGSFSPHLMLALFSRHFSAPQPDWPEPTVITGFCFHDRDSFEDVGTEELNSFLDAGPPPIVFTLGSSAVWAARDFYTESLKAARALGTRAVLLVGKDARNQLPSPLPDGVATFAYAPYSWLFPRAAAIVHQGGIGTTAQALRAGRPMLVVPYGFDQFDNADHIRRLGVGDWIRRGRYNAGRATAVLRRLLGDRGTSDRADRIGRAVRAENGPSRAADALEELARTQPRR